MGFMVILHMVCYLYVFDVVSILKNQGFEGDVFGKAVVMFGLCAQV